LKYYDRINKAKQEKQVKYEKLNPNINELYEKIYRKQKIPNENTQPKEEEYCTFNPNKKKFEFQFMKNLRSQLHAINLDAIEE